MCFRFGVPKIWDRIQTIPFKAIPKASRHPQYGEILIVMANFLEPLLLGGINFKEDATQDKHVTTCHRPTEGPFLKCRSGLLQN